MSDKLIAALEEALEFVEQQEDVCDGPDGQPQPNAAMLLAQTLRAALSCAPTGVDDENDWRDMYDEAEVVLTEVRTILNASGHWKVGQSLADALRSILAATPAASAQPARRLTEQQQQDLLAAALFISAKDDPDATLTNVSAERIVDLLESLRISNDQSDIPCDRSDDECGLQGDHPMAGD
jgi:hypothetical protein